jgi:hypothetical protein
MVDLEVMKFLGFHNNFAILDDSQQCKSIPLVESLLGCHRTYLLHLIEGYGRIQKVTMIFGLKLSRLDISDPDRTYPT